MTDLEIVQELRDASFSPYWPDSQRWYRVLKAAKECPPAKPLIELLDNFDGAPDSHWGAAWNDMLDEIEEDLSV